MKEKIPWGSKVKIEVSGKDDEVMRKLSSELRRVSTCVYTSSYVDPDNTIRLVVEVTDLLEPHSGQLIESILDEYDLPYKLNP